MRFRRSRNRILYRICLAARATQVSAGPRTGIWQVSVSGRTMIQSQAFRPIRYRCLSRTSQVPALPRQHALDVAINRGLVCNPSKYKLRGRWPSSNALHL